MRFSRSALWAVAASVLSLSSLQAGCIGSDSTTPSFDAGPIEGITIEAGAPEAAADVDVARPAPETTLTEKPDALTNQKTARFAFSADRPSTFACKLDESAPQTCTSPFSSDVGEGEHTFSVGAISDEGTPDPTPATYTWKVDLTAPKTTISKTPPALDNGTTATFEFSADESATFQCALDTAPSTSCTSPFAVGGLTDGAHVFTVTATDAAGNVEIKPPSYAWTVDTTMPDTQIDSGPSGTVSSKTASFTFSSPNAGTGATFECSLDGAAFATCTSPRSLTGLADGSHTFQVRAKDAVGNTDPSPASRTWTVDTVAPDTQIDSGPSGTVSSKTASFTFSSPNGGTGTTFECSLDAAAFATCTSPRSLSGLADGAHTFQVRAKDAVGNADASPASRTWTVDTVAPTVTITSGPLGPTNDATPTFTFSVTGATKVECRIDAAAFAACNASYTPGAALAEGAHAFQVRGTDAANNMSTVTRNFTVDTTPPSVVVTSGPTSTAYAQDTFTFNAESGSTTTCRIFARGAPSGAYSPCTSPYTTDMPPTPGGSTSANWTFEVLAVDAAGNGASAFWDFSTYIIP